MKMRLFLSVGLLISICPLILYGNTQNRAGADQPCEDTFQFDHIDIDQEIVKAGMDNPVLMTPPSPLMIWIRRIFTPVVVLLSKCYDNASSQWKRLGNFLYQSKPVHSSLS